MGAALSLRIGAEGRFVPPVPLHRDAQIESAEKLAFKYNAEGAFTFTVERQSDGQKIWDTSIGGFMFGNQFIQIATFLSSDRIYGFGENMHHQLKHDFGAYKTWALFSRDQPEDSFNPGSVNEYGVHPFYMALEPSGKAHGVLILNSNAQEYTLGPAPHLIYRTIGGQLELFFFPGPDPEEVIRQYQQLIGRPYLPAYWAFGFQLCRFGYKTLEDLKAAVQRTRDAQIPFDVQYADIDYMELFKDFTYDKEKWAGFPEYAEELHSMGMKLFLIFDPPVQVNYSVFQRGKAAGASFVEWPTQELVQKEINDMYEETKDTKIMLAPMWPYFHTAFPDWLDPEGKTTRWWVDEFVRFHKELPFDGIWIDMNEPAAFGTNDEDYEPDPNTPDKPAIEALKCPQTALDFPPYRTWNAYQYDTADKISLCQKTLCMIGTSGRGNLSLYDTHSLYGWSETVATLQAIRAATGSRGSVISRSTFPSSGHYGGHWLGDNESKWSRPPAVHYRFNMFGIPQVGADVCGFGKDTNEELCLRWQQLGAFYSYFRNHNIMNARDQDPAQWPSVATATRVSNLFRYRHLPYLFSLHFRASLHGGTVLRPLFFEFPADPNTHTLSFQFMWGPAVLVVPVISPGVDSVRGYLPPGELWYSMSEAHLYGWAVAPGYSTFNAPRDTPLPVFIRVKIRPQMSGMKCGHIIPRQVPALTTAATRQNPFQLLIALKPTPQNGNESTASGELFWDDGETPFDDGNVHPFYQFQFFAESSPQETRVHINCTHGSSQERLPIIDQLELLGHQASPLLDTVKVNGAKRAMDMTKSFYDVKRHLLVLQEAEGHSHPLDCRNGPWTVSWQNEHNETSNGGQASLPNGPLSLLLLLPALSTLLLGLVCWPSF